MVILQRFQAYAADFEKTYVDDDWSRIAPYFAADAVYEVRGMPSFPIHAEGRAAVLEALKGAVDGFDRRCASRTLKLLEPPTVDDGTVTIRWGGTYTLEGAPDLEFVGVEEAHYNAAGEIERLVDVYTEDTARTVGEWIDRHRDKLQLGAPGGPRRAS